MASTCVKECLDGRVAGNTADSPIDTSGRLDDQLGDYAARYVLGGSLHLLDTSIPNCRADPLAQVYRFASDPRGLVSLATTDASPGSEPTRPRPQLRSFLSDLNNTVAHNGTYGRLNQCPAGPNLLSGLLLSETGKMANWEAFRLS